MRGNDLTIKYSIMQAGFWMDLCVALSFSSVYLLGLGYSNTGLGLIIATGNLLGAALGPAVSSMIDRYESITAARAYVPTMAARMAMVILLAISHTRGIMTTVSFILYIAFAMSINSLNLKLYVDSAYSGTDVNYGVARGMGSLSYVIISFILGYFISNTSVYAVIFAAVCVGIIQLAGYLAFTRALPEGTGNAVTDGQGDGKSLAEFARSNKLYCLILAGTVLMFFSHNTVCNFLINVVRNAGGDSGYMGFLNGFMALVEIPVMLFFTRIPGHNNSARMLRIGFAFFTVKAAAIAAAPNIPLLTASFLLQAPSYGIYTAAIVPYVEKMIRHEDSAKAQSLAFSMTTMGAVLAGLISGALFDHMSVTSTLWISAAACAAGSVIAILGTRGNEADSR